MSNLYINGMECEAHDGFSLVTFFDSLAKDGTIKMAPKGQTRILRVASLGPIAEGVLFTDTDQKSYLTVQLNGGNVVATVEENAESQNRYEYSFFRLNTISGRGLFTQYRGSGGVGTLRWILGQKYKEKIDVQVRDAKKRGEADVAKELESGKLLVHPLAPNHDFVNELNRLRKIKSFEFKIPSADYFQGGRIKKYVDTSSYTLRFSKSQGIVGDIKDWIIETVTQSEIQDGKVKGKSDTRDEEVPINPDALAFSKMELSEATDSKNFPTSVLDSPMLKKLGTIMDSQPNLFANRNDT